MLRKVYRVKSLSHWPYEEVLDARVVEDEEQIELHCDYANAGHRIYRRHPEAYVEWAFMVEDHFYGDHPEIEMGAVQLEDVSSDVWLYVGFTLLSSQRKSDDSRLEPLRKALRKKGAPSLRQPKEIAIEAFTIGDEKNPQPLGEKQMDGSFSKERVNHLHVSDASDNRYPIINSGSIPEEYADDFDFVHAGISTLTEITTIPTHAELIATLDEHLKWFDKVVPATTKEQMNEG